MCARIAESRANAREPGDCCSRGSKRRTRSLIEASHAVRVAIVRLRIGGRWCLDGGKVVRVSWVQGRWPWDGADAVPHGLVKGRRRELHGRKCYRRRAEAGGRHGDGYRLKLSMVGLGRGVLLLLLGCRGRAEGKDVLSVGLVGVVLVDGVLLGEGVLRIAVVVRAGGGGPGREGPFGCVGTVSRARGTPRHRVRRAEGGEGGGRRESWERGRERGGIWSMA
ncbi:uncharacterized protein LAESUDRAFT_190723 [Laetiporus sulphureus 93-53]|uniref:Uncharacterized protein n=1 Tax=Laetiporus sulphureus 93-53 TaxID=1314785 RepID=A0A165E6E5_9APHY|nr:uncharacterized protein LAESUDRAFT_190723 [Laetiporus sulphureus 93-53]KZT06324.1 hypothetical protein LAESUDRAFT_190723 [Laetiporus sulphureus 93-53]